MEKWKASYEDKKKSIVGKNTPTNMASISEKWKEGNPVASGQNCASREPSMKGSERKKCSSAKESCISLMGQV